MDIDNQCLVVYCKLFWIIWQAELLLTKPTTYPARKAAVPGWCQGRVLGVGFDICSCYLGTQAAESWGLHDILTRREFSRETRAAQSVCVQPLWLILGEKVQIEIPGEGPGKGSPGPEVLKAWVFTAPSCCSSSPVVHGGLVGWKMHSSLWDLEQICWTERASDL